MEGNERAMVGARTGPGAALGRAARKRFPAALEFYQSGASVCRPPGRCRRAAPTLIRRKALIERVTAVPGIAVSLSVKALLVSIVVAAGEIGDKVEIATVIPAAKFNDPVAVIASQYPLTAPKPRIILPV